MTHNDHLYPRRDLPPSRSTPNAPRPTTDRERVAGTEHQTVRLPDQGHTRTFPKHVTRPTASTTESDYDPADSSHVILYTGTGTPNFRDMKLMFMRGSQMVTHTSVPRFIVVKKLFADALEDRKAKVLAHFADEVRQVNQEFDAEIRRELEKVEATLQKKSKELEQARKTYQEQKERVLRLEQSYRDARRARRSPQPKLDWAEATSLTDLVWPKLKEACRQLDETKRRIVALNVDLGTREIRYDDSKGKTHKASDTGPEGLDPAKPLLRGSLRATAERLLRLRRDKRARLRQLIRDAASAQEQQLKSVVKDLFMVRGLGDAPQVFIMTSPTATPMYSPQASVELANYRSTMIAAGAIREGRWGISEGDKRNDYAKLSAIGVTRYLEASDYTEALSLPNRDLNSGAWYEEELRHLEAQGRALKAEWEAFTSQQEERLPGASHKDTIIRDLEQLQRVIKTYGREQSINRMAYASSLRNRVLQAEIDILRARYLEATGIPQQYAQELQAALEEARADFKEARTESREPDEAIRAARMKLRQALGVRREGERLKARATLELQRLGAEYRALSEGDRRKVDSAMRFTEGENKGRWKPLDETTRAMLGPTLLNVVRRLRGSIEGGTGPISHKLGEAYAKIQDGIEAERGARAVLERAIAAKEGAGSRDAQGWATPEALGRLGVKAQWEVRKGGAGGFRMKAGRFMGFSFDEMPLPHVDWVERGAPFETRWGQKQIEISGSAGRLVKEGKLSAEDFAFTVGEKVELPESVKFTLVSNMEKMSPGGRRKRYGDAVFRNARRYWRSHEAQERSRLLQYKRQERDVFSGESAAESFGRRYVSRYSGLLQPRVKGAGIQLFSGSAKKARRYLEEQTRGTYQETFGRLYTRYTERGLHPTEAQERAHFKALEAQEKKIRDEGMKIFNERLDMFGRTYKRALTSQELIWDAGANMPRLLARTPEEAQQKAKKEGQWSWRQDDWKVPEAFSADSSGRQELAEHGEGTRTDAESLAHIGMKSAPDSLRERLARAKRHYADEAFGGTWDRRSFYHRVQMQYLLSGRDSSGNALDADHFTIDRTIGNDRLEGAQRGTSYYPPKHEALTPFHPLDLAKHDPDFISTDPKTYAFTSAFSKQLLVQAHDAISKTRTLGTLVEVRKLLEHAFPQYRQIQEALQIGHGFYDTDEEEVIFTRLFRGEDMDSTSLNVFQAVHQLLGPQGAIATRQTDLTRMGLFIANDKAIDVHLGGMLGLAANEARQSIPDEFGAADYDDLSLEHQESVYEGKISQVKEAAARRRVNFRPELSDTVIDDLFAPDAADSAELIDFYNQKQHEETIPSGFRPSSSERVESDEGTLARTYASEDATGALDVLSYGWRMGNLEEIDLQGYSGPGRQFANPGTWQDTSASEALKAADDTQIARWLEKE